MSEELESLTPVEGADRSMRRKLDLKDEFVLILLPTVTVLGMLLLLEVLSRQRLSHARCMYGAGCSTCCSLNDCWRSNDPGRMLFVPNDSGKQS